MKERNIAICIILSMLTCGIYGIVWFIEMTDDTIRLNEGVEYNTSGGTAFLLSLITCGIYSYYWAYQMGKALAKAGESKNIKIEDNAVLYLILQIFGLGIVNYCLIQNDLNKLINAK